MPKILARDPAWLSQSTPGWNLFTPHTESKPQLGAEATPDASLRRITHRGTELFAAVGNEIRWSELGLLQDVAGEREIREEKAYRVLKTPASRPISQISVSPSGDYLAVMTSHTCHVCILPVASHLRPQEATSLRLKSFQIGPTAHVLENAPLVSGLWHPLSPSGDVFVTVTLDACVRLWELDSENRSSFNEPAVAIDLKKLANAASSQIDCSTSKYGANKGFSPDDVEMQVAAACFGGQGMEDEHGWASMTLWIAMTEGDVYALCPFLPSSWRAPSTLLPSLSTSVVEKSKALSRDGEASESERRIVDQQTRWLADVDAQEPLLMSGRDEFETVEVYSRPKQLNAVPRLQGPFQISPEPDFGELTDIYVIAPKLDDEALYDDFEAGATQEGLSVSIICLATSTNEVHVCLDVDGVEAEWLPSKRSRAYAFPEQEDWKELVLFESIDLARSEDDDHGFPTFTTSPSDRYELLVTYPKGVCTLSFKSWVGMLEDELSVAESGAGFRMNVVLDSATTDVSELIDILPDSSTGVNAALAIIDPILGYIVLTSTNSGPFATILDIPSHAHPYAPDLPAVAGLLPAPEPRAPYRPAAEFEQPSGLPRLTKMAHDKKLLGGNLKGQVRFSPATLQLLTSAHRIMSNETHQLGMAAADLFRRCERMRMELQEQIRKVAEIANRVDAVTGDDEDEMSENGEEEKLSGKEKLERRIDASRAKTFELNTRADALRRKMSRLDGGQLSAKELLFAEEVAKVEESILRASGEKSSTTAGDAQPNNTLTTRYDAVSNLRSQLVGQADQAASQRHRESQKQKGDEETLERSTEWKTSAIGRDFRKQRLAQVMTLLERETALLDAVMERLKRLQGAS